MKRPNYNTILPPPVRFDRKLSASAKLLYGEIKALCDQQGYCWASNHYLASLYGVHKETISLWLRQLKAGRWIRIELLSDQGNLRKIYLTEGRLETQSEVQSAPSPSNRKSQEVQAKDKRGLTNCSPPSCELIAPKPAALLIENIIDNNDRIHSPPLKNLLGSDEVEKAESRAKQPAVEMERVQTPNPPVASIPVAAAPLPPPKKESTVSQFAKPSVEEVESYMLSQKELCPSALTARAQALRFVNYYESNGWRVGRNAMQDWRAAANNWLLNTQTYEQTSQRPRSANHLHSKSQNRGRADYSIPL